MRTGKVTENALKRSVFKQIRTEFKEVKSAAVGSDCAFSKENRVFSCTSSVVLNIPDSGYYAVMKAATGLISQGIKPDHVTVTILLPEDSEEKQLREIVADAIEAAKLLGTVYAGGHTEVTSAVVRAVVSAYAVGYSDDGIRQIAGGSGKVGDAIIMTGWAGMEGTAMIAAMKREELSERYPVPFIEEAIRFKYEVDQTTAANTAIDCGAGSIHDLSQGGVFAGLWEMAEKARTGLVADLKAIPVRQETIEICEFFEINPYILISGGALLVTTKEPELLISSLRERDINSSVIGYLREGNDRIITNGEESRYLELPHADEVHKVL